MKELFNFFKSDYFLLSTEDEFLNEYSHNSFKRLQFATGFTGSYGFALFSKTGENKLFVDGRYTLQAKLEISTENFTILPIEDLKPYLKNLGKTIAIDSKTTPYKFKIEGVEFEILEENPIDKIWNRETNIECDISDFQLAGETKETKFVKVLQYLKNIDADALFVFNPHDVCWLFNIRGNYLQNSPIVNSFAIISKEVQKLVPLNELSEIKFNKILVPNNISLFCYNVLKANCKEVIFEKEDFILNQKTIKTESEIECIKKAMEEDGKALFEFEKWLKSAILKNETEFTVGEKLLEFRKKQKGFVCESFPAIVGFAENGAIVHYKANEKTAKKINEQGLLLIDSGGQYYDEKLGICGTTDVTRVFAIGGMGTEEERRIYTLVLKGHIALATAIFPEGTTGAGLDILARQFLYENGLNYNHGTGHGVGYFLSVHEGPIGISKNYHTPLKEGMIISNEPGCYLENKFGIRFENLILVKKHPHFKGFLCFETLTKAPIEKLLLDYEILTDKEIDWLTITNNSLTSSN